MNFKKFLIYLFVILMAILTSWTIVFAGDITSGNSRMKVESGDGRGIIYFDKNTSISELEGYTYSLNYGRVIVDGEVDVTINDREMFPTVRIDGRVEITFNEDEISVRVIKGEAKIYFSSSGPIRLNECDYWRIDKPTITRNCWFWSGFERWALDDGEDRRDRDYDNTEVQSVIESHTLNYIIIRVYEPYWGGYCRIRYYCSWPCYDWYWEWGYGRYCDWFGCYWRPHRSFWSNHYWSYSYSTNEIEVRREYRRGDYNSFPYRPKSIRKVDNNLQERIIRSSRNGDFPKKPLKYESTRQNEKFDQFKQKDTYKPIQQKIERKAEKEVERRITIKSNSSQKSNSMTSHRPSASRPVTRKAKRK